MKNIKWNKGLFRIWIIISVLWIIGTSVDLFTSSKYPSYGTEDWLVVVALFVVLPPILLLIFFVICQKLLKWIVDGFRK